MNWLAWAAMGLASVLGPAAWAQISPATLPANLQLSVAGVVFSGAFQTDGKLLLAGSFSSVNGVPRNGLARINPNGSVDVTWNPPKSAGARRLVVNDAGIFVAASFTAQDGLPLNAGLAKLNAITGALDASWNPGLSNEWYVSALATDGTNLFVGIVPSGPGPSLLKIAGTGAGLIASEWNPLTNGRVNALAVAGTNLFVGGSFTTIGGRTRNSLAKISTLGAGTADPNWNPDPDGDIEALAFDGTNLFVGGDFASIGGRSRTRLAKLKSDGNGAADSSWNPSANNNVTVMAVQGSQVYAAGDFTSVSGQSRTNLVRLSASGGGAVDPIWKPELTSDYNLISPDFPGEDVGLHIVLPSPAGILVGGSFTFANGVVSLSVARLDALTGIKDPTLPVQVERPGDAFAVARQPDGKLVVGGHFFFANELPRSSLLRFNADGTLDTTWFPQANGIVQTLAISGTDIFVGGRFTRVGGLNRNRLAKLSSSSDAADPVWNPDSQSWVFALALRGTELFVGGAFGRMGGLTRNGVAKVSTTGAGTVDPIWHPGYLSVVGNSDDGDNVSSLVLAGTNLFIGGSFICFVDTNHIGFDLVKVSSEGTGALDLAWLQQIPLGVGALAANATDLFVGGFAYSSVNWNGLHKLSLTGNGAWDAIWNPAPFKASQFGNQAAVTSLALAGNDLYVGGRFDTIGGAMRTNLAKLSVVGAGQADPDWNHPATDVPADLLVRGTDVYAAGSFADIGGQPRIGVAFLPVADAPLVSEETNATLFVRRNPSDGAEVTHFRVTAIGSGVALLQNDGLTPVAEGDFITAAAGASGLRFVSQGGTNSFVSVASALNDTPAGVGTAVSTLTLGAAQAPAFTLSNSVYRVSEGGGSVAVHVRKSRPGAASVTMVTADGTARGGPDYQVRSNLLNFASNEAIKSVTIGIANDFEMDGDKTFLVRLLNPTGGAIIGSPGVAIITIVDNDGVGSPDSFTLTQLPNPPAPPPSSGMLSVELQPPLAVGQWRLTGEFAWHDSGAFLRGLVTGNYRVEFKPVNGFLEPPSQTVPVASGASNHLAAFYTATAATSTGELTVLINPPSVATNLEVALRGQWRRQGEGAWRGSGERIPSLSAGIHLVEFKPVAGRATPPTQNVSVISNQNNVAAGTYLYSTAAPGWPPEVLSFGDATTTEPFLYNGQIQTDLGFGSGVVVKPRVVLTAAHVLFNDALLSFVGSARWFFQKHKGDHEPLPQTPRGWYIFDGYAAQRQADNSPGVSTPASQALDAAAMYFVETPTDPNLPGRGGFGGFLASDDLDNPWLTGSQLKMLVGYPIDTIAEPNQGRMHATIATNAIFTSLSSGVFSTTDLKSYPGNSGGPLYAQHDGGIFYPAAIYLGGSAQTLVRAIDSQVVDLINRAEISGHGGGNNTGGGVALWSPGLTGSPFVPGLFRVTFVPADLSGKAGWRVRGADDPAWIGSSNLYYPLIPGPFNIEFKPVPGYSAPPFRRIEVVADQTTLIDALYNPIRLSDPRTLGNFQLTLNGRMGRAYSVQWSREMVNWSNLVTLTNLTGVTNVTDAPAASHDRRFYRAVEW